jgi:1,4-alpha-glucan branching enzyme
MYENDILIRWRQYASLRNSITRNETSLDQFASGYKTYGLTQGPNGDIHYLEWVPNASKVCLVGDFNNWNPDSHQCKELPYGKFSLDLPADPPGTPAIPHNTNVKVLIYTKGGQTLWRPSPWVKYTVQYLDKSIEYNPRHWAPPTPYQWQNKKPKMPASIRIYEGHVGICSPEPKVSTYRHFADDILPRIANLGYSCVELMAIMEHAYYGSFGYHVTSFFAVSSRYGTPDDLKYLVDKAHGMGLLVILDIVHSHASKNVLDGLNHFDGTDNCYFKDGPGGDHTLWDSKIFDYKKWEVLRFLLSNLCWYIEEYHFDGFRFDGVTSMLYHHRGIGVGFTGNYEEYFNMNADINAIVYLMLANSLLHEKYPDIITIAEDVSGMPSLCRPVLEGGVGFDYRLAMAVPDMWIKLLKEKKDEDWNMCDIWWALTNRRYHEKCIAYAESHDQALVGDKTLSFWLMDAEMYTNMSTLTERTVTIDRGMALHKMIRLITMGLGGEGYLTFIGNEFGHPEWLDFPREGNNFSYWYARRQFNLVDDNNLRYRYLRDFDGDMQHLDIQFSFLSSPPAFVSRKHDGDKVIVFDRVGRHSLVFIFNFHPTQSFPGYRVGVPSPGKYKVVLDSDQVIYDGHGRVDGAMVYPATSGDYDNRPASLDIYIPSRVAIVLCKTD